MNDSFSTFFASYMNAEAPRNEEDNKLTFYAHQKYLFMVSQVDSKKYNFNTMQFSVENCVKCTTAYSVYVFGPFMIVVTSNGNVHIENPRPIRRDFILGAPDKYIICTYADRQVSYNEDYIVTPTGHIVFRDANDEFYNLQYEGKPIEAMTFALRKLGVIA